MENPTHQPYLDSPSSSQPTSPTLHASPASSETTIKPLPALPPNAPAYSDTEPYQDDPHNVAYNSGDSYRDDPHDRPYRDDESEIYSDAPAPHQQPSSQQHQHTQPYTDTPDIDTDNIPLAHLLHLNAIYPTESPPSYSVAIRETQTHRDTLIQYIPPPNPSSTPPSHYQSQAHYRPVLIEFDPESGEVVARTDDVRHSVEKVVAMFVVAIVLLVLSGVMAWMVVGSGLFR
ncbi:hypothetical protein FB567DRAFT_116576 [Paraphoma chrysanthemicola]|uniref:Uncharacterized protein n=1 Tax=Paraphoma chrysanthemicola TaxID=798071 RepID=A0A8K0R1Y2_9PLEO|nr:hypothetical protein FB567DRAFT_116576 [Paraphoma chrysanthemicola]